MGDFKFSNDTNSLWFNPLTNEGPEILVERNQATDKAQIVLGILNPTKGNRIKFNPQFERTQTLVFQPGESKKAVNLTGITTDLPRTSNVRVRINNVSEGDTYSRPSEITVKLINKNPSSKNKENTPNMATQSAVTNTQLQTLIQDLSKTIQTLSTRLTKLETQGVEDKARDENTLARLSEVDSDTSKTVDMVQKMMNQLTGSTGGSTGGSTSGSASDIAAIVKQVLESMGVTPAPTSNTVTITMPDGSKQTLTLPTKPTCPPIATTVYTPVQPKLKLVYEDCNASTPTTPVPVTNCGTPSSPMWATLANGWMNTVVSQPFPNSYDKAGYYKDGNRIYLMGNVTGGADQLETANKTKVIFTIPKGCAPTTQQTFAVSGKTTNGGIEAVELIIYPNADGSAIVYAQNEGIMPQTIAIVGNYLVG